MKRKTEEENNIAALRTTTVRRAVLAPELERFLSRKSVDLLVTDQIEAIAVRVRKGIEVFDRKLQAGIKVARKRATVLTVCAATGLGLLLLTPYCLAWAEAKPGDRGLATLTLWGLAGVALIAVVLVDTALERALADQAQLQRVAGHSTQAVEEATTIEELLAHAESVLTTARKLGALP